jgi:hypothetical protein
MEHTERRSQNISGGENHESNEGDDAPQCIDERYSQDCGRNKMKEGQRNSPTNRWQHKLKLPLEPECEECAGRRDERQGWSC